jgi:NAD(P)-dependent dehydrogenase (short-subunit alcohol dehydrogenase family)
MNGKNMKQLEGKIILVTGASEGIGAAVSFRLAQEGAQLALAARRLDRLEALAVELDQSCGGEAAVYSADVTDSQQVTDLVDSVLSRHGRLDVLINNVGQGLRKPLVETSDQEWQHLLAVNLSSVFYCCRAVIEPMRQQGGGRIINIASRSGRVGEGDLAAYSAVKHGVVGLTRALAEAGAEENILVNAVCPGPVNTTRMARLLPHVDRSAWLKPEDVAEAVLLLATGPGSRMRGQSIDLF